VCLLLGYSVFIVRVEWVYFYVIVYLLLGYSVIIVMVYCVYC